jgi:hypothetical protein
VLVGCLIVVWLCVDTFEGMLACEHAFWLAKFSKRSHRCWA